MRHAYAMKPIEPLPLYHSWPLCDRTQRFDAGTFDLAPLLHSSIKPPEPIAQELEHQGIGLWECELDTGRLTWSAAVHDLFGIPRDVTPTRERALAVYADESRAAMEHLRTYAIKHRRGFTIDVELHSGGTTRWMRLIAAPVCSAQGVPTHLHGIKIAL